MEARGHYGRFAHQHGAELPPAAWSCRGNGDWLLFLLPTWSAVRDRPTALRSPWQNGHVERLIGSIRRECLDHLIIFGEAHLRRVLWAYANYYNGTRTHLSLGKDAPLPRAIRRDGRIQFVPYLGGLHHSLVRI